MEKTQLLVFANIAAITYEDPKTAKTKFKAIGCTIVEFFNIDNAQAYLLKNNDGIHVLSFRGTEVTEPSDVLADLKAGKNIEAIGGKIHVGFKGEINKLWPAIEKAVTNIDSLYVTGHSLGAAMATIASGRMQSKVIALVTFGSPRVGNKEYVNRPSKKSLILSIHDRVFNIKDNAFCYIKAALILLPIFLILQYSYPSCDRMHQGIFVLLYKLLLYYVPCLLSVAMA